MIFISAESEHCDKGFRTDDEFTAASSDPELRPGDLITLLSVPCEQCADDLGFVIRQSNQLYPASKSYGAAITSTPRFQAWISADNADFIFVEGQFDSNFGRISPLSPFCTSLAQRFEDATEGVALTFFCGQHVASSDRLRGRRGLIRSLLRQLLHAWPKASVHANTSGDFSDEATLLMQDFCSLFQLLLSQVPDLPICCIIDDLAQFEQYCWDEDYFSLLHMFASLVEQEPSIRFKVLITSSGRSKRLQEQIPEDRCVRVTERDLVTRN